jgi:hypothetical protein
MSNNKKYEFGFDLAGLATYTDEVGGILIRRAILEGETAKVIRVQPGIKGTQAINLLDSTLVVQDGSCGWNTSGSTTFTQRDITVCDLKVNEALCPRDLNDYWLGQLLTPGSYNETVPFEQQIAELKTAQISQYIENLMWQGTTGTTCFNGFKYLFAQLGTGTTSNSGGIIVTGQTAMTAASGLTQVDNLVVNIPDDIADSDDLVCFMSHSNYRKYLIDFRNSNYFHLPVGSSYTDMKTYHPGTNILVKPVGGLVSSNQVVIGKSSYMVMGVDLLSDSEGLRMFYSQDFDEVRLRANFKVGVNVAFPQFFVSNGLA